MPGGVVLMPRDDSINADRRIRTHHRYRTYCKSTCYFHINLTIYLKQPSLISKTKIMLFVCRES